MQGNAPQVSLLACGHLVAARVYPGPEYPAIDVLVDGHLAVVVELIPGDGPIVRVFAPEVEEPIAVLPFPTGRAAA